MPRPIARLARLALLVGGAALVAACSGSADAAGPLVTEGVLATPAQGGPAMTYAPATAPEGAQVALEVVPGDGSTTATFRVTGMLPDRGYAVHAHVRRAGRPATTPARTSRTASTRPRPRRPRRPTPPTPTRRTRSGWTCAPTATAPGRRRATVPFAFPDRAPASVVVHEKEMTATAPGQAGTAGGRLACLTSTWR